MKLVCSKCFQEMGASFIARFQHTREGDAPPDADGHHIAINAQRTWCDGEWLEYAEKLQGYGMLWNGGLVGAKGFLLANGKPMWFKWERWMKADGTEHKRRWVEIDHKRIGEWLERKGG